MSDQGSQSYLFWIAQDNPKKKLLLMQCFLPYRQIGKSVPRLTLSLFFFRVAKKCPLFDSLFVFFLSGRSVPRLAFS